VEAATARDDLAAEAAAKAELEARVAALEADLAVTLTWLEVGADMKSRNDIAAIFIIFIRLFALLRNQFSFTCHALHYFAHSAVS
jgi:hypothetical protein